MMIAKAARVTFVVVFCTCFLTVCGCKTAKTVEVFEAGSSRVSYEDVELRSLMATLNLGMSEGEVCSIMGCSPDSRWEDPDFKQVVCFWYYSKTSTCDGKVSYNARSYWFKFEDNKLVGALLKKPDYMLGNVNFSLDARWHYRKHVFTLMSNMYYKKQGKRLFFNDDAYCYVVGKENQIVDYWDGKICHWKRPELKPGYQRVESPDGKCFVDIPYGKTAVYMGNGRFNVYADGKTMAANGSSHLSSGSGGAGSEALSFAGTLLGAFVEGAAEGLTLGLTQGLTDGVVGAMTKHRVAAGGGAGYVPSGQSSTRSSVKPRVKHSYCHGSGICQICKGKGRVGADMKCTGCGGTGRCRACHGSGWAN